MLDLRRRQFITLLGGAAAWPLGARAQQTGRMRRIAMLVGATENDPEAPLSSEAFRQTLNQLGWKEGVSVRIDTRWGAGDPDRMHAYAKELIDSAPDVAVADSTPAALALQRESRTTPILVDAVKVEAPVKTEVRNRRPQAAKGDLTSGPVLGLDRENQQARPA
jgi:putative tryptophan/tyrosine transport system substrate-binding protein